MSMTERGILDAARPRGEGAPMDRLDPRTRLVLALGFTLAVILAETFVALGLALAAAAAAAALARLSPRLVLRRLWALEGFMVMALALLPFTVPGPSLGEVLGFPVSAEGLRRAGLVALRANGAALAVLALVGSLEAVALGRALGRLGAPERLVHLFLFTIRYLDVLNREYDRLRLAMRARAFRPRAGLHCWTSLGYLFGMLLVRSLERAERIDAAMRCRGFSGRFPSLAETDGPQRPGALDWGVGAASTAMLALVVGLGL